MEVLVTKMPKASYILNHSVFCKTTYPRRCIQQLMIRPSLKEVTVQVTETKIASKGEIYIMIFM